MEDREAVLASSNMLAILVGDDKESAWISRDDKNPDIPAAQPPEDLSLSVVVSVAATFADLQHDEKWCNFLQLLHSLPCAGHLVSLSLLLSP